MLEHWAIPTFPITGKILKANGVPPGKNMGVILHKLKREWKATRWEGERGEEQREEREREREGEQSRFHFLSFPLLKVRLG